MADLRVPIVAPGTPASAPFRSPRSAEANGSLSFHSGCAGVEVVTADGSVLPTDSAAGRNARPFFRY
jgi:hypothetical protein